MKPILLPCPRCGEAEACITIDLGYLGKPDSDQCMCSSCGTAFNLSEVQCIITCWGPILAWLEQAPHDAPEPQQNPS